MMFYRFRYLYKDGSKWQATVEITPYALSWMQEVQTILQTYTGSFLHHHLIIIIFISHKHISSIHIDRTDGSYIEKKETGLTWHYEHTDSEFGTYQAKDLFGHLEVTLGGSHQAEVLNKNKRLEVKTGRTGKHLFIEHLLYKEVRVHFFISHIIILFTPLHF